MKRQKGQALIELLLLMPLFLAFVLTFLTFARLLEARLALIHVCRDTALALNRDPPGGDTQLLLQTLVHHRNFQKMGVWKAQVTPATPGTPTQNTGFFGKVFGALVGERLTVTLELKPSLGLPPNFKLWTMTESVVFLRNPWNSPYKQAALAIFAN